MHLSLLALTLAIAIGLRLLPTAPTTSTPRPWPTAWQNSLWRFAVPPLLLLSTCLAIVLMGRPGSMWGMPVHNRGFLLALGFLAIALVRLLQASLRLWQTQRLLQSCTIPTASPPAQLLPCDQLFAGQVGWWRSQLVLSQGVLTTFGPEEIEAIVAHEQAHSHFRDTFWFFWLGWLRSIVPGLPYTDRLWQELLLLREQRADAWAAQRVDPLLLAETLVTFVQQTPTPTQAHPTTHPWDPSLFAAFSDSLPLNRLEERVTALLHSPIDPATTAIGPTLPALTLLQGLTILLSPLITIPFHHL